MKRHGESHLDHGIGEPQIAFLLTKYADRHEFFIDTFQLPEELGTVPCGLYGPVMGDEPVPEAEVHYGRRGAREYDSRLVNRPTRQVRDVTIIAGPHDEEIPCPMCQGGVSPMGVGTLTCHYCTGTGKQQIHHDCIIYTVFGGALSPQEPGDPGVAGNPEKLVASQKFWAEHALAK